MLKIGFGSRMKPREFGFKPRYYDPIKEELDQRLSPYMEEDKKTDVDTIKDRIRRGLKAKSRTDQTQFNSEQNKKSNLRLVFIFFFLLFLAYLLLSSNKMLRLIESLSN